MLKLDAFCTTYTLPYRLNGKTFRILFAWALLQTNIINKNEQMYESTIKLSNTIYKYTQTWNYTWEKTQAHTHNNNTRTFKTFWWLIWPVKIIKCNIHHLMFTDNENDAVHRIIYIWIVIHISYEELVANA